MKQCSACGLVKPFSEFYAEKRGRDGLRSKCKACMLAADRARWADPSGRAREAQRQYVRANIERVRANQRAWKERNRERIRITTREQRRLNPEPFRERQRRYEQRHPDRIREHSRQMRRKHPEIFRAGWRRRMARLRANGGNYTQGEWRALCEQYGNVCLACGAAGPLTADHVVPVSKGGSNDISNIQCLCKPCNSRKGDRIIDYRP